MSLLIYREYLEEHIDFPCFLRTFLDEMKEFYYDPYFVSDECKAQIYTK